MPTFGTIALTAEVAFVVVMLALVIFWAIWLIGLPSIVTRWVQTARGTGGRSIADEAEEWLSRQRLLPGDSTDRD